MKEDNDSVGNTGFLIKLEARELCIIAFPAHSVDLLYIRVLYRKSN